jgi:hypothetical protein
MSYTHNAAIATCTVANIKSKEDVLLHIYDYLTNHEDEIPPSLEWVTYEGFVEETEQYLELDGDKLTIKLDTEDGNYDQDIFDFISAHYATLMVSKYMKVIWITYDSRSGLSGECYLYDKNHRLVDIDSIILGS